MSKKNKKPSFIAIQAENYDAPQTKAAFPQLAGRLYFLFSTSKKEHTYNLSAIGEDARSFMKYYDHARPSVLLATPNYSAPDLERGKDLTWASVNVLDTVVWILEKHQIANIVYVNSRAALVKELTVLRDQKINATLPACGDKQSKLPQNQL